MSGDTVVRLRHREIEALLHDPGIADMLLDAAGPVVVRAQVLAPKRTGLGARSIRAETVLDGPEIAAHITWDRDRFYMYFQDVGTTRLPALHFLEDALEGVASS